MFRIEYAVGMFLVWAFLLFAVIETKSAALEVMLPILMILLVCYLFAWSIYVFVTKGLNNGQNGMQSHRSGSSRDLPSDNDVHASSMDDDQRERDGGEGDVDGRSSN